MTFVQTISIETNEIQPVQNLVNQWHSEQVGVAPGYQRTRILADEERSGHYVIEVDFSSKEDPATNNERAETAAWAKQLADLVDGDPTFTSHSLVCSTE